eukprot:tig00000880_g5203.t1
MSADVGRFTRAAEEAIKCGFVAETVAARNLFEIELEKAAARAQIRHALECGDWAMLSEACDALEEMQCFEEAKAARDSVQATLKHLADVRAKLL